MADDSGLGIPGKGPLSSISIGLMGLLLLIAIILGIEGACSGSDSYSLGNGSNTMEQYCDQYPQLCATVTP